MITAAYSSNLTALLTVSKSPPVFETIRELHEAALPVASLGTFFRGALASAADPYLKVGLAPLYIGGGKLG